MPSPLSRLVLIMALALVALLGLLSSRASGAPLLTGFLEEQTELDGTHAGTNMNHIKSAGATTVRYFVYWRNIAPTEPSNPRDPEDPAYDWADVDNMVLTAQAKGLQPILDLVRAPTWAEGDISDARYDGPISPGSKNPNPTDYGNFAFAAATRYSGTYDPPGGAGVLPRVKYWQVWNETNYPYFLLPQYDTNGNMKSAVIYRNLVNHLADEVRSVAVAGPPNFVIAGGTAPWGHAESPSPLAFARAVLCIQPTCTQKTKFDAWATHPYTKGGPTHKADHAGDVELGDLPTLRKLLNTAQSKNRIVNVNNASKADLWVTEFSWDSDPPDPKAVPRKLHQRWTAEALYRMWKSGVRMLTWFTIRDRPLPTSRWQSGFWYCGQATRLDDPTNTLCTLDPADDVRKPSFEAFRFPFVAFDKNGKVSVWGRVPPGASKSVTIQRKKSGSFKTVKKLKAASDGTFKWTQTTSWTKGFYRAKITGETSIPFSLSQPKAFKLSQPFGCGGGINC